MSEEYGVVIVEDDPNTRAQLADKLETLAQFKVLAACGSVAEAQKALAAEAPDLLLVDLGLPDGTGLDIITAQSERRPDLPILVISVFGDERSVIRAIEAGAQGYLLKSDTSLQIEACLQQLLAGGAPISAPIARYLIKRLRPAAPGKEKEGGDSAPARPPEVTLLSERELEVLQLAAKGYSYQDIAELLEVKVSTVSSYTRRLYQKLSVHSRSEAVFEAMRLGLVDGPRS